MSFGPLVSAAWLKEALGAEDLRVLDASWFMPAEGRDARAEFAIGHVPGARFFDIDEVADPEEMRLPHMVPSAARFARLAGDLGIGNGDRVVIYDSKGLFSSARAWWLFGLFGHDLAAVLDGGLPAWLAAGGGLEAGEPARAAPAVFVPRLRTARWRGLGDMLEIVAEAGALVLDARPAGRFEGTAPEPRAGLPSGHMPGSRNVPYGDVVREGRLRSPAALRELFEAAGVDGARPIVTTCGSGVTAAVLSLALLVAGLPQGALYDGSWSEWAATPGAPRVP